VFHFAFSKAPEVENIILKLMLSILCFLLLNIKVCLSPPKACQVHVPT